MALLLEGSCNMLVVNMMLDDEIVGKIEDDDIDETVDEEMMGVGSGCNTDLITSSVKGSVVKRKVTEYINLYSERKK